MTVLDVAFLGTRVDPSLERVPAEFAALASKVNGLVNRWMDGSAEDTEVLSELAELTIVDTDGNVWAYGATTGRWFVRSGDRWQVSHPTLGAVVDPS